MDLDKKCSFIIFAGTTFDREMPQPSDFKEHGEYLRHNFTFIDIGLDKKWSSIIFVERTFFKETLEPSDLEKHGEYAQLGRYSMT